MFRFSPDAHALNNLAADLWRRQQENIREVCENLQRKGYAIPADVLSVVLAQPSSAQPHALVAALKAQGHGLGTPSAGQLAFDAGIKFITHDVEAIVDAAHQDGGVCLVAHPGRDDGFLTYNAALFDELRSVASIDGLEVYYPAHTPAQVAMYQEYAQRHSLLVSAGSDSHGPENPPIRYRAGLCQALLERLGFQVT